MTYEKFCRYFWNSAIKQKMILDSITQEQAVEELKSVPFPSDYVLMPYFQDWKEDYEKAALDWLCWLETPADSHIPECAFH